MIRLHLWQFLLSNVVTVGIGAFLGASIAGGVLIRKLDLARLHEAIDYNEELIDYLDKEREDIQEEIAELDDEEHNEDDDVLVDEEDEE